MESKSFREFVVSGKLQVNPSIRRNVNGYPYITVLDPSKPQGEQAENIYFGKNTSAKVSEMVDIRGIANDLQVVHTTNALGEQRIKLSMSAYLGADDLFGI